MLFNKMATWFLLTLLSTLHIPFVSGKTIHIFVSPQGLDSNTGFDVLHPVKTLQKAKTIVDAHAVARNTIYVELLKGYYDLPSSLHFTHGYPSPVTFRSYQGQEVHVTGGRRLPHNLLHAVTDKTLLNQWTKEAQSHIRQVHLPEAGITDVGSIHPFGWYVYRKAGLELFINGKPLTLARYPNVGFMNVKTAKNDKQTFTYNSTRDSRWAHEKEPWAYGYWYYSWSDLAVKIGKINAATHTITLASKTRHGIRPGQYRTSHYTLGQVQGGYFRVFNMLSELDEPGEYFIDRTTGMLYVWPNTVTGTLSPTDVVYASMLDNCIVMDPGVSNIIFEGFTIEACRVFGISANNVTNIKLSQMELKNTGGYVFQCAGDCRSVTVSRCEIHDGDGGIEISGGDRVTLTSSGNVIEDNHIWKYSREGAVGQNGVHSVGVNNIIRYNHIHDGQYAAVKFDGNDQVMEYNNVHHNCLEASDCGSFHATRSWAYRGNIIRYNHIHHTLRRANGSPSRGVMLDDQFSSVNIEHNVFYENEVHVDIGGGRDNIVRFNIMYDATYESVHVDRRGISPKFHNWNVSLHRTLDNVPYTGALWTAKYPKLAVLYNGHHTPRLPEGNQIYKNIVWNKNGREPIPFTTFAYRGSKLFDAYNNHEVHKVQDFYSPKYSDFRPRCATKQWADGVNFELPVSIKAVGPRYTTGPTYLHTVLPTYATPQQPKPCDMSTVAPAPRVPGTPYLSDGSGPNPIYPNIPKEGCWFISDGCPVNPGVVPMFRDTWGEQHEQAGVVEEKCLGRAIKQWYYCGQDRVHNVKAVFGPTGAMTVAGYGCFFSYDTCPNHLPPVRRILRDVFAENTLNATTDAQECLARAKDYWTYCGYSPDYPVTVVFGATGEIGLMGFNVLSTTRAINPWMKNNQKRVDIPVREGIERMREKTEERQGEKRTVGAGCWIKVSSCPGDSTISRFFYDAWGATNVNSGNNEDECFQRATYYWQYCGSYRQYPVTAYFRPHGTNTTVPN